MLNKISDNLYIEFNQILVVERCSDKLYVTFKNNQTHIITDTTILELFIKKLNLYLGLEENKNG